MAYTVPSVADFKARFPEITATDALIQIAITDAATWVDNSWSEVDYAPAILFLAAHFLRAGGVAGAGGSSVGVASESFGSYSVSYANAGASILSLSLSLSGYGLRFSELRRRNRAGPRVVA